MTTYVRSYAKTITIALVLAAGCAAGSAFLIFTGARDGPWRKARIGVGAALLIPAAMSMAVVCGGGVVLLRVRARVRGHDDLFLSSNGSRSDTALSAPNRRRSLMPLGLRVGDEVEILSHEEILRTLDSDGKLDGLPFMGEMERFCGTRATVFRRVDKIYDYGGAKDMRRLRDTVSLVGLRCDGSDHGGCEARCYLLWKTAWLRRARSTRPPAEAAAHSTAHERDSEREIYDCQFTSLVAASQRLNPADPRQDLRPLLAGNVAVRAFGVALLTRLFNWAQRRRGGTGFPGFPAPGSESKTPTADLGLQPGELVRVRRPEEIAATLNAIGRNRGLWFDRDMLKYCEREFEVERRVERIIDDATGKMLKMKTPCITLRGVLATGEFLRLCPQHDALFWREIWLARVEETERAGR